MPSLLRNRLARMGLLLAAVLHLGGGLLESAHAEVPPPETAAMDARGGGGDPPAPVPHDGQHCPLCQAMGTAALPEARATGVGIEPAAARIAASTPATTPAHCVPRAPARAPPAAA